MFAPYIVGFSARSAMLIVEADGDTHGMTADYDQRRTVFLQRRGWRVLRFTNSDIMYNIEGVLNVLASALPLSRPR